MLAKIKITNTSTIRWRSVWRFDRYISIYLLNLLFLVALGFSITKLPFVSPNLGLVLPNLILLSVGGRPRIYEEPLVGRQAKITVDHDKQIRNTGLNFSQFVREALDAHFSNYSEQLEEAKKKENVARLNRQRIEEQLNKKKKQGEARLKAEQEQQQRARLQTENKDIRKRLRKELGNSEFNQLHNDICRKRLKENLGFDALKNPEHELLVLEELQQRTTHDSNRIAVIQMKGKTKQSGPDD